MKPKFVADEMLGKLARWMRIFGCDVSEVRGDDELLEEAKKGRILLTRDRELYRRALLMKLDAYLLSSDELEEQLFEVFSNFNLRTDEPERCTVCNGLLEEVEGERWRCRECGKEYWIGSHWKGIEERRRRLERRLSSE
ncbi:MAG: uncharacterized protein PWR13_803 [Archaeoglobi archaeon]|nr:uncharacterized protein [Archaeoglobi archaeon]MDK2781775.1 uncharacterized protein [Archaeoglobi archaeon]